MLCVYVCECMYLLTHAHIGTYAICLCVPGKDGNDLKSSKADGWVGLVNLIYPKEVKKTLQHFFKKKKNLNSAVSTLCPVYLYAAWNSHTWDSLKARTLRKTYSLNEIIQEPLSLSLKTRSRGVLTAYSGALHYTPVMFLFCKSWRKIILNSPKCSLFLKEFYFKPLIKQEIFCEYFYCSQM